MAGFAESMTGAHARSRHENIRSALRVLCEDVALSCHDRVARDSTLRIVSMRGFVSQRGRRVHACLDIVLEHGVSPPSAVFESLGVPHHEVEVIVRSGYVDVVRSIRTLFRSPLD